MIQNFQPGKREWAVGDRAILCIYMGTLSGDCRVTRVTSKEVLVSVPHYKKRCKFSVVDSTSIGKANFGAVGIMTEKECEALLKAYAEGARVALPGSGAVLYIGSGGI